MNTRKKPLSYYNQYVFLILIIITYIFYYIPALTDLTQQSFWLFIDERISYDGIQRIYQSHSFYDFLENISFGGDLRYGRLFWNINAVTSYIPSEIWGHQGQIVTTRLTQFLLLLTAYYLLVITFINDNWLQLMAFIFLIFLPETQYFTIEPKPEPAQLFFLSLFLYYGNKNSWSISAYIMFLGIALALKISLLFPTLALIGIIIIYNKKTLFKRVKLSANKTLLQFLAAILIIMLLYFLVIEISLQKLVEQKVGYLYKLQGRPALLSIFNKIENYFLDYRFIQRLIFGLLISIVIAMLLLLLVNYVSRRLLIIFAWVFAGIVITTPCILFIPFNLKYAGFLIANNSAYHGSDNSSVNFIDWIKYLFNGAFYAPYFVVVVFFAIAVLPLFKKFNPLFNSKIRLNAFLLLLLCMLSFITVFLSAKRLWPHYLQVGLVLFTVAYFSMISSLKVRIKLLYCVPAFLFLYFNFLQSKDMFETYSNRTKSLEFKREDKEYKLVTNFINKNLKKTGRIFWDGGLFFPDNVVHKERVMIIIGYFNSWEQGADYVLFKNDIRNINDIELRKTVSYLDFKQAQLSYNIWTHSSKERPFFYQRVFKELREFKIYKKVIYHPL